MTECTNMECSGEAEFAYWMPDLGQFSRVRNPEHDLLDDGDLAPYVCESCRDRMADSPHWEADRFARPVEKLATDGGHPRRSRRTDPWTRPGGEGLPAVERPDKDTEVWLFTCCLCGRRWTDPPGPVVGCRCGSEQIAVHRFDVEEYHAIKFHGDPQGPDAERGGESGC